MGRQGGEEITVHDMAKLKNSVSYDVLTDWRLRLRRKCVNGEGKPIKKEPEPHQFVEAVVK